MAKSLTRIWIALGSVAVISAATLAVSWVTRDTETREGRGHGDGYRSVSLDSADSDGTSVTAAELFPAETFNSRGRHYRILDTDAPTDCTTAAGGEQLLEALKSHDCRGVVRATATDPSSDWAITFGVADLPDAAAAQAVDAILVDPRDGRFTIMPTETAPDIDDSRHFIKVRHQAEGHYVLFFAITKMSGGEINNDDPDMLRVFDDITEYLLEGVRLHALTGGDR